LLRKIPEGRRMAGKKEAYSIGTESIDSIETTGTAETTGVTEITEITETTGTAETTGVTEIAETTGTTGTTGVTETAEAADDPENPGNRIKLFDGELKLMELLWSNEGATARELALLAADKIGWNKNTTYTVIKKLVAKGAIKRSEPNFVCCSLITREEVGRDEARKVLRSFFGGSAKMLFSSFMADGTLSAEEADELRKLIDKHSRS
jgi:predicted transcriptional regulator